LNRKNRRRKNRDEDHNAGQQCSVKPDPASQGWRHNFGVEPPQHIARSRTRCWRTTRGSPPVATSSVAAATSALSATVDWYRPPMPKAKTFPRGFSTTVTLTGQ